MLSTLNCETKQSTPSPSTSTNNAVENTSLLTPLNHDFNLDWLTSIFAYSGPTEKEIVLLRRSCKLFSKALKPLPCWTSFPHPKYSSLTGLLGRINVLSKSGSTNVPKLVLIDNGIHDEGGNYVRINISISIVGESREHCVVIGGLRMNGKKEDDVNVSDLTLRKSKEYGVYGCDASMHLDNVSVENSGRYGVVVNGSKPIQSSKRNTMKNCNVSHSKESGLYVRDGGLMTIDGNGTTIHHNGTNGYGYGLRTYNSSIHLVSPLTKEMISTNKGNKFNPFHHHKKHQTMSQSDST